MPITPVNQQGAHVDCFPVCAAFPPFDRVGVHIVTFEACSGFTHVTARWIARPPKATFVTRLRSVRLLVQTARQLPDQSTTLWVDPSSTGNTRRRGAPGWLDVVLRSVGLEPSKLSPRVKLHFIARLAPLVEANFNFIELGPRGTGKSYFFSEFSPYATLISGGQATKATLFYNNARGKIGLVGFWDTVAFDEVGGIKIKDPDTIQIMKDFMANGRFSRGVEIIANASMAFVGNIDQSVEQIVKSTRVRLVPAPAT